VPNYIAIAMRMPNLEILPLHFQDDEEANEDIIISVRFVSLP
jgi:hypothetical protein